MLEKQDPCRIPTGVCRESIFLKDIKVVGILAMCTVISMSYQFRISVLVGLSQFGWLCYGHHSSPCVG